MKTKDITYIGLSIALIAIGAQVSIPIAPIPFTLQVLTISLVGYLLTPKQALVTILTYIIIGILGLPVFSAGRSGLAVLASPSFGFIVGFIPLILLISKYRNPIYGYIGLYTTALTILYLITSIPAKTLIYSYYLPFVPSDTLSLLASYYIAKRIY